MLVGRLLFTRKQTHSWSIVSGMDQTAGVRFNDHEAADRRDLRYLRELRGSCQCDPDDDCSGSSPAIGVSAAMGVALGVRDSSAKDNAGLRREFTQICDVLAGTSRATAVNLFWATSPHAREVRPCERSTVSSYQGNSDRRSATHTGRRYCNQRADGKHGAVLMPADGGVLTHCNAGALAAAGYGMALWVIRAAVDSGKKLHVFADETRPLLQGSRLTAWELMKDNIPDDGHLRQYGRCG